MANHKKLTILAAFILVNLSMLTACNTVEGFGKDMQKGGQAVQNAAEDGKHS